MVNYFSKINVGYCFQMQKPFNLLYILPQEMIRVLPDCQQMLVLLLIGIQLLQFPGNYGKFLF